MTGSVEIDVHTTEFGMMDITGDVRDVISKSGFKSGIVVIYSTHTSAGITVNENADPDVRNDIMFGLRESFPDRFEFKHSEGNSCAHIMTSVIGSSATVIVENGEMLLGLWQGIFICEFDGPRARKVLVKMISD
ncbi:MAG: secondary thiamine-phosphate synthase enzyme YjbQ [Candidatus Methanogranum gryphiswaldense]|nr:MAG: secondary thiamine-phosphate synthase enzyme YjbQ [Candidatus Methanogranum sp. U3.2.1]